METSAVKPKKKPTKIEDMTKEEIRQAILKKRECNAKAQAIVENLLEKTVTEDYFMQCLPQINQSHFEDIIEERSIIHICGYPLCSKSISEKDIPKQKYRISVKTNKVYDITGRKNFCSNSCYEAAMHIKKQMLTSPLWFREYEVVPKFALLSTGSSGSMGQEIDVSIVDRVKITEQTFTSINDFANASLNEMGGQGETTDENNTIDTATDNKQSCLMDKKANTSVVEKTEQSSEKPIENKPNKPQSTSNIVGEIVEKPERKIDPILSNKPEVKNDTEKNKKPQKKELSISGITIEVEKCLAEWFTLDTMLFLLGEEKVKEMVADKGECIMEYLNNYANSIFYTSNSYDQYQTLCRKLNMLELGDRKFDANLQKESKPLPDYSILQEESKRMQLKVKAYLAGETEVSEPVNHNEISNDGTGTQLPLVDKNAQNALRRRIVNQQLNRVLPDLLRSLGLASLSVSQDVHLLVNTFKLTAKNIMFKPVQWTLITIIIIKLLSLRDKRLEYYLEQPNTFRNLQLLLLSYKHDGGYLERLICWLTDIDRLLDSSDTQLTIE